MLAAILAPDHHVYIFDPALFHTMYHAPSRALIVIRASQFPLC